MLNQDQFFITQTVKEYVNNNDNFEILELSKNLMINSERHHELTYGYLLIQEEKYKALYYSLISNNQLNDFCVNLFLYYENCIDENINDKTNRYMARELAQEQMKELLLEYNNYCNNSNTAYIQI